jgi:hypothetical protein
MRETRAASRRASGQIQVAVFERTNLWFRTLDSMRRNPLQVRIVGNKVREVYPDYAFRESMPKNEGQGLIDPCPTALHQGDA